MKNIKRKLTVIVLILLILIWIFFVKKSYFGINTEIIWFKMYWFSQQRFAFFENKFDWDIISKGKKIVIISDKIIDCDRQIKIQGILKDNVWPCEKNSGTKYETCLSIIYAEKMECLWNNNDTFESIKKELLMNWCSRIKNYMDLKTCDINKNKTDYTENCKEISNIKDIIYPECEF